ncbi:MAG TPA: error-prone DNA polymerase, partial [Tepidisphaeraceae bacterium]|nr:error-prone DNA polymerase [Tepidisphaeraceae bacterium]
LTCVREGCTIQEAGHRLFANAERYLKEPRQMYDLFAHCPAAIERGLQIAQHCTFSLADLKYEYPTEVTPVGVSPSKYLRDLTYEHARGRYPEGIPQRVVELIEKELTFICGSKYESYFLTVYDLVRYARSRGILCQGRGSAANSAVCYCLGVTSVDPAHFQLVFERFASSSRAEPPDIDIDFEHERREEVIQYVYKKYGRERAAMTASLITYRGRSAVRDVGKALGFRQDMLDQLAGKLDWWHSGSLSAAQLREAGVNPADPGIHRLMEITRELLGFPRHLSQHVGGMVVARSPLDELVPVENAAMEDRTVIEWDKDDLDVIGLFKVDILALGMMTAISKALVLINDEIELHTIPHEDPATYEMLCDADSVGVFQVESRAQMSMLPRLQPRKFYDLVVEVAIVRPGPIQGKMVHPYLQRREMLRADPNYRVEYPKPELEQVLRETLGIPLFQEQAMRLAIVGAGFTADEADQLRRAMAAWKRGGGLGKFHGKFINGMITRGYEIDFAERCFQQISGFGEYGFPESHAASFAKLVYASAWIKRHHPAAFCCALLNSQPMGFYAPAQLVRDARAHGVEVRSIDVNASLWDCTLEASQHSRPDRSDKDTWGINGPALRLGFRQIKGLKQAEIEKLIDARSIGGRFSTIDELQHRATLSSSTVRRLADADAFGSLDLSRRHAAWDALALDALPQPLPDAPAKQSPQMLLPLMPAIEETLTDYATTGLTLRDHPVSFARPALQRLRVIPSIDLLDEKKCPANKFVRVAGLVLCRQRPGTASGVVFITLEDESGIANLIVWSHVYERFRPAARHATLLQVDGLVQREGKVIHILARQLYDRSELLTGLLQPSRDFH